MINCQLKDLSSVKEVLTVLPLIGPCGSWRAFIAALFVDCGVLFRLSRRVSCVLPLGQKLVPILEAKQEIAPCQSELAPLRAGRWTQWCTSAVQEVGVCLCEAFSGAALAEREAMALQKAATPSPLIPLLLLGTMVAAMTAPWFKENEGLIVAAARGMGSLAGLIPFFLLLIIVFLAPESSPSNSRHRQVPPGPSFYDAGTSQYGLFLLLLLLVVLASVTSSWQSGWHSALRA